MNYFAGINTAQGIKNTFKSLAAQFHPDHNPAEKFAHFNALMRELLEQYHAALNSCDGQTSTGSDGKEHTYHYSQQREQGLIDALNEVLKVSYGRPWEITVVGSWLWVGKTSRDEKDLLNKNGAGLRWHSKRKLWYWKPVGSRTHYSGKSFDYLKAVYGAEEVKTRRFAGAIA